MKKVNFETLLGYTNNMKPMSVARVEKCLNALIRYKGEVYTTMEYLIVNILEGGKPLKVENYTYYKKNGEKSKPKTLYKLNTTDNCYIELKKMEYDFVVWSMENFSTLDDYLKADRTEMEKLNNEAEMEKIAIEEEEKRAEEKAREKENFKKWNYEETIKVFENNKPVVEIVDSIFKKYYPDNSVNIMQYSLIPLIANFDNPLCKQEIISRLHNDNKASIKIFEVLTGISLPKTYKKRIEYIESLTIDDFNFIVSLKVDNVDDLENKSDVDNTNDTVDTAMENLSDEDKKVKKILDNLFYKSRNKYKEIFSDNQYYYTDGRRIFRTNKNFHKYTVNNNDNPNVNRTLKQLFDCKKSDLHFSVTLKELKEIKKAGDDIFETEISGKKVYASIDYLMDSIKFSKSDTFYVDSIDNGLNCVNVPLYQLNNKDVISIVLPIVRNC